jgi:hypothetical protein
VRWIRGAARRLGVGGGHHCWTGEGHELELRSSKLWRCENGGDGNWIDRWRTTKKMESSCLATVADANIDIDLENRDVFEDSLRRLNVQHIIEVATYIYS